jgi:prepilin-type N-terminal cleavage/methylation domain-containing protein
MARPQIAQGGNSMHPSHSHPRREAGFSLVEVVFALMILAVCAAALINHLTINYQATASERDRVFAYTKAQAILAEIQGFVDRGSIEAAVDLDILEDGIVNKPTLSITTDSTGTLVDPAHVVSGNYQRNGEWLWSRRISVQPFAGLNNRNVRYVTVRIFRKDGNGTDRPMADLSAVINSGGSRPARPRSGNRAR